VVGYSVADSVRLTVLYGPKMILQKFVRNEATTETSYIMVHVSRGESVTFHLTSQNDDPADTSAWHATITDSFATLVMYTGSNARVGPSAVLDSFTYVAGSETVTNSNSFALPDSIAYFVTAQNTATPNVELGPGWTNWIAYSAKNEVAAWPNGPGGAANVSGIKWYWRTVVSRMVWSDSTNSNVSSAGNYLIHTQFSVFRNDN